MSGKGSDNSNTLLSPMFSVDNSFHFDDLPFLYANL